jgi:hypothetical protein
MSFALFMNQVLVVHFFWAGVILRPCKFMPDTFVPAFTTPL